MKKEILRIQGLSTNSAYGQNLQQIYLNLYEGEALGIVGLHDSGKSRLFNCLSGEETDFTGRLFFQEEQADVGTLRRNRKIYRVKEASSLVETLSVLENLMVIRRHRKGSFFIPWKKIRQQARICLEEFQMELDVSQRVSELRLVQRHEVEILKAYLMGARLILIDDILMPYSNGDYMHLYRTLCRFQERGVSFMIAGCQLEKLQILTQRCLFMVDGCAVKMMDNVRRKQIDELRILMGREGASRTETECRREKRHSGAPLLELQDVRLEDGLCLDFQIREGEIVVLLDIYQQMEGKIRKFLDGRADREGRVLLCGKPVKTMRRLKKEVYINDFLQDRFLFPSLSLRDNLCFTSFRRISTLGFIRFYKARAIERLFREEYQERSGGKEFCWDHPGYMEKTAIYMERIRLQKWKLMFCFNMENRMSCEMEPMMKDFLIQMTTGKRSVCIVASSFEKFAGFADYYLVPTEKEGIQKFTYQELREYFHIT